MLTVRCALAFLLACVMVATGCGRENKTRFVSLEQRHEIRTHAVPRGEILRVVVGGMIIPRSGLAYYHQLLDYVGEKLGMHVYLIERESYFDVNRLVRIGAADVAFVCGSPYVDGHDEFGMELLAVPKMQGGQAYSSYIIVRKDSSINTLNELRGKNFAFTDPMSNTGWLIPLFLLAKMNEDPDTFFKKTIFTRSHERSIKAVAQGVVDGAAVNSLIWRYGDRTEPQFTSQTRIIMSLDSPGIPPVVVRRDLDPRLKERLRRIFLNAHRDEQGRTILRGMMIERFSPVRDSAYDSIRAMKNSLAKRKKGGAV